MTDHPLMGLVAADACVDLATEHASGGTSLRRWGFVSGVDLGYDGTVRLTLAVNGGPTTVTVTMGPGAKIGRPT